MYVYIYIILAMVEKEWSKVGYRKSAKTRVQVEWDLSTEMSRAHVRPNPGLSSGPETRTLIGAGGGLYARKEECRYGPLLLGG
jgi:hypothetical protein